MLPSWLQVLELLRVTGTGLADYNNEVVLLYCYMSLSNRNGVNMNNCQFHCLFSLNRRITTDFKKKNLSKSFNQFLTDFSYMMQTFVLTFLPVNYNSEIIKTKLNSICKNNNLMTSRHHSKTKLTFRAARKIIYSGVQPNYKHLQILIWNFEPVAKNKNCNMRLRAQTKIWIFQIVRLLSYLCVWTLTNVSLLNVFKFWPLLENMDNICLVLFKRLLSCSALVQCWSFLTFLTQQFSLCLDKDKNQ